MAMLFDFFAPSPREEEDNEPHVHARPALSRTITTEEPAVLTRSAKRTYGK